MSCHIPRKGNLYRSVQQITYRGLSQSVVNNNYILYGCSDLYLPVFNSCLLPLDENKISKIKIYLFYNNNFKNPSHFQFLLLYINLQLIIILLLFPANKIIIKMLFSYMTLWHWATILHAISCASSPLLVLLSALHLCQEHLSSSFFL